MRGGKTEVGGARCKGGEGDSEGDVTSELELLRLRDEMPSTIFPFESLHSCSCGAVILTVTSAAVSVQVSSGEPKEHDKLVMQTKMLKFTRQILNI